MKIEKFFKASLIVSFFLNTAGAAAFLPWFVELRKAGGLPEAGNAFYGWVVALFIFLFGIGYLWQALSATRERLFITIAALGKISFALLIMIFVLLGELPLKAIGSGIPDLVIGVIFAVWVSKTKPHND
ncbi:MAG: hypothetical protein LUM44_14960 [Pyrinomonadaceae bacterium]|nr:hypothetical protein [Pyrinomonadaceae bacterium]